MNAPRSTTPAATAEPIDGAGRLRRDDSRRSIEVRSCHPNEPLRALVLAIAIQFSAVAHAQPAESNDDYINPDRPGIADGSNVVGDGRFQIETGLQKEYRRSEGNRFRTLFVPTLLRLGVGESLELRLESNAYTWQKATYSGEGTARTEGFAPVSVGLKYHFIDSLGSQRPSLGVIVRVFPRSGTREFRTTRVTGDVRIAADWDFAPQWSLNPNVGVAFYEDGAERFYASGVLAATLNYNPSKNLNFFIDAGAQSPETRRGRTAVVFDLGMAYVVGRDVQLDFSVGSRVAGETPPRPFLSAGLSKRF